MFPVQAGTFAVEIFFVLSGFVIARSASRMSAPLLIMVVRRYLRLTVPMVVTAVIAWLLLRCFPNQTASAGRIADDQWTMTLYGAGPVALGQALADALWGVYRQGFSYIDPVLWTMKIELIGSVMIYVLYALLPRAACLVALGLALGLTSRHFGGFYLGFAFGTLLHEMHQLGWLRPRAPLGAGLVSLGLAGGALCQSALLWPRLVLLSRLDLTDEDPTTFFWSCSAALIVAGIILWPGAQTGLSHPVPRLLGRISFFLYLVHFPLLCTAAAYGYVSWLGTWTVGHVALWESGFVAMSVALAWALTMLVDEPTVRLLSDLKRTRSSRSSAAKIRAM